MNWASPSFWKWLWIVPAITCFYVWAFGQKRKRLKQFADPQLVARLLSGVSYPRQYLKAALLVLCLLFAILALARPQWGFHWENVTRRGVDIFMALDVSKSMLAEDISPNRLEGAKREGIDLLHRLEWDRVGLIAFAGEAYIQSPLTSDYDAVALFLNAMDTDWIPTPGTAIGKAITMASKAFEGSPKNARVLILITDGEDHGGTAMEAAKKAHREGIKIYAIGVGREGGAPIPEGEGGFKKDRKGEIVLARLDERTLQKIAAETGGSFVRSVSGERDLTQIYEDIREKTEGREQKIGRQKRFEDRYQWPLLISLLCLLLEGSIPEGVSHRRLISRSDAAKRFVILAFFLLFFPPSIEASSEGRGEKHYQKGEYPSASKEFLEASIDSPQNGGLQYNAANSYYKMEQYRDAEKLFSAASERRDPALSQKAYYNLGNTAYRQGKLFNAVAYYDQALKIDPRDKDAKFNRDFVLREIERRMKKKNQKQSQSPQGQSGDKKQGKSSPSGNEKKKGEARAFAPKPPEKRITPQEAKQWLSELSDDPKPFRKKGPPRPFADKDW